MKTASDKVALAFFPRERERCLSSGSNRILIVFRRLALLCIPLLYCEAVVASSAAVASPSSVLRVDSQSAKRREPRKAASAVRRQQPARKGGDRKAPPAMSRNATSAAQVAPGAGKLSGVENRHRPSDDPTEGADLNDAMPDTRHEGPGNRRLCPSRAELESIARTYCSNNMPNAVEARVAWESKKLKELEAEVSKKSEALAALVKESRTWVERRERLAALARDGLVEVYAKMRPEVAAQQLGAMSEESAASIITKLNPRSASAILNEMGSEKAARLADGVLRGVREKPSQEKSGS